MKWVDFAKIGVLCWDGWTLLRWVDFVVMGKLSAAPDVCFEGSGVIVEDFFGIWSDPSVIKIGA